MTVSETCMDPASYTEFRTLPPSGGRSPGRTDTDLLLQALLMAVWRRKLRNKVFGQPDQGSRFSNDEWRDFLDQHTPIPRMGCRGTCWDNAVAEGFCNGPKRARRAQESPPEGVERS